MRVWPSATQAGTKSRECLVSERTESSQADPLLLHQAAAQAVFLDITRTFDITFVPDLFAGMRSRPAYLETAWDLFKEDVGIERMDRLAKRTVALAICTNRAGIYFILASPHTFGLNALNRRTYDKVLSAIRFFLAFDRYLSEVQSAPLRETTREISAHIRDEYWHYEPSRVHRHGPSQDPSDENAGWLLVLVVLCGTLLPIAVGAYLLLV